MYIVSYMSFIRLMAMVKVDTKESYLEIDVAIFVHVECAENVIAKFFRVAGWEKHFIHVDEFCRR